MSKSPLLATVPNRMMFPFFTTILMSEPLPQKYLDRLRFLQGGPRASSNLHVHAAERQYIDVVDDVIHALDVLDDSERSVLPVCGPHCPSGQNDIAAILEVNEDEIEYADVRASWPARCLIFSCSLASLSVSGRFVRQASFAPDPLGYRVGGNRLHVLDLYFAVLRFDLARDVRQLPDKVFDLLLAVGSENHVIRQSNQHRLGTLFMCGLAAFDPLGRDRP